MKTFKAFSGGYQGGKSHHAKLLAEGLRKMGLKVVVVKPQPDESTVKQTGPVGK